MLNKNIVGHFNSLMIFIVNDYIEALNVFILIMEVDYMIFSHDVSQQNH